MIAKSTFSSLKSLLSRVVNDETGGETVEWVLIVGLIAAICMFAMREFGNTLALRWNQAVDAL